jgi:hypothetical protein
MPRIDMLLKEIKWKTQLTEGVAKLTCQPSISLLEIESNRNRM